MATTAQYLENAGAINHARDFRRIQERLLGFDLVATPGTASGGIMREGDLLVAQRAAGANMSVDVAVGLGYADGSQSAVQGGYFGFTDAVTNVTIDPSDPTNPRIDLIGLQFRDTEYTVGSDDGRLVCIKGTAAGVPAEPTCPNNFVTLARVDVAAAAGSITNANITDRRRRLTALGGTIICATDSVLPTTNLWNGQVAFVLAHASYSNAPMVMARVGGAWVPWKRLDSFATPSGEQVLLAESNPSGTGTVTLWNASLVGIRHLVLRWTAKTTNAGEVDLLLRLNNDSAVAAYHYEQITETASGAPATAGTDATYFKAGRLARTGGANDLSTGVTEINDLDMPLGSDVPMLARWWEGVPGVTSELGLCGGMWRSGATVTRVDVAAAAGNFTAGSRFTLYGIRA